MRRRRVWFNSPLQTLVEQLISIQLAPCSSFTCSHWQSDGGDAVQFGFLLMILRRVGFRFCRPDAIFQLLCQPGLLKLSLSAPDIADTNNAVILFGYWPALINCALKRRRRYSSADTVAIIYLAAERAPFSLSWWHIPMLRSFTSFFKGCRHLFTED